MKRVGIFVVFFVCAMQSIPALACSVAPLQEFEVTGSGEGEAPPRPEIMLAEVDRADGRDEASCAYLGRLRFVVDNPGDYGLLFETASSTELWLPDRPIPADGEILILWDDGDSRRDDIDADLTVTPVSRDGVFGDPVSLEVSDGGELCSTAGGGGLSLWALGLGVFALVRRWRR